SQLASFNPAAEQQAAGRVIFFCKCFRIFRHQLKDVDLLHFNQEATANLATAVLRKDILGADQVVGAATIDKLALVRFWIVENEVDSGAVILVCNAWSDSLRHVGAT